MIFYFKITDPEGGNFRFSLSSGETIVIGRKGANTQLGVNDNLCSSKHCKVIARTNEIYIEDLKSKNGVFLNGIKILRQKLYLDDVIKIGNTIIFIDTKKLGQEERDCLSYSGTHVRANGSLTLEIDSEEDHIPIAGVQGRRKPIQRKKSKKSTKYSSKKVSENLTLAQKSKKLTALSIDSAIALGVFIFSLYSYRLIFPKDAAFLFKDGFKLLHLFHDQMSTYTLVCFLISIVFFYVNRNFKNGSIGQRLLKVG